MLNFETKKVANGAGHIELLNSKQLGQKFPWLITDDVVAGCYGGNHEVIVKQTLFSLNYDFLLMQESVQLLNKVKHLKDFRPYIFY